MKAAAQTFYNVTLHFQHNQQSVAASVKDSSVVPP